MRNAASQPKPPSGSPFDPTAEADDTLAAVVQRAEAGWSAHEVEAAMAEAGYDLAHAADVINEAWTVVL